MSEATSVIGQEAGQACNPGAGFHQFLGLERWLEGELAQVRLARRPELLNGLGQFHGGVLMSLLDVAMAGAIRACAPGCSMVTVDLATHFLGSAQGDLRAVGRLLRRTGSLCFCQAEIHDATGVLVATGTGSFRYWAAQAGAGDRRAPEPALNKASTTEVLP